MEVCTLHTLQVVPRSPRLPFDAEAPFSGYTLLKMQVTMHGFHHLERSLAHTNCAFPFCVAK